MHPASNEKALFHPETAVWEQGCMHVTRSEQKAAMCYSDRPGNDGVVIKLKVALGTYAGIYEQGHPLQKTWMEPPELGPPEVLTP